MAVKAAGSVTVASITDVASTTRYYLLQSSTLTAPSAPTASPPGGSWAATEPTYTEGSTNSLYTCDLTTFSDGTFAYSAVSLSTSYEAAKTAYNKADSAKSTADSLATLIREDADGVTVGKSADGKTWSTTRTRMGAAAFEVLTKAGEVASSFGEKVIELGKNSQDAIINMLGGLVTIKATSAGVSDGAWCEISTDEFVSTNGYHASRIAAGYKDETGFIPQGVAEVMVEGGEGDGGVLMYAGADGSEGNSFAMSPAAYTLNHPEYLRKGLRITQGTKVCTGHGTPWVTLFETWDEFQSATGCYDSGTPTLVTMNGDWGAFDGTLSGCEIQGGNAVYVLAQTTSGLPNIPSTQSLRINWICIW